MNTLVINISVSGTLIALDIAKKHHDAKIRHPDGRTSYLRIENTLEGFNRLLALTASPHEDIIAAFEPTADYHRNIAWWLPEGNPYLRTETRNTYTSRYTEVVMAFASV